jgi:hypothetical protein
MTPLFASRRMAVEGFSKGWAMWSTPVEQISRLCSVYLLLGNNILTSGFPNCGIFSILLMCIPSYLSATVCHPRWSHPTGPMHFVFCRLYPFSLSHHDRSFKEMSSTYLCWPTAPSYNESKCRGRGEVEGSQPMSTAVHITWHGAQINFGDLPPYLTYSPTCHLSTLNWQCIASAGLTYVSYNWKGFVGSKKKTIVVFNPLWLHPFPSRLSV